MSDWDTPDPSMQEENESAPPALSDGSLGPESEEEVEVEALVLSPRQEIEKLLEEDQSRLGDVYRLSILKQRTPQEIADQLNIGTVGFVYGYRARIDAILDGQVTNGATLQRQVTAAVRSFVKRSRGQVGAEALHLLGANLALSEQAAAELANSDSTAEEPEAEDDANIDAGVLDGKPGIYAFSYGWYLEKPVDEKSGNTLIKVGRTADVGNRIRQHRGGARAHMPEPLVVVRVYATGALDPLAVEAQFHRLLSTAGHNNPRRVATRRNEVGQEWFLTNEAFLDAVAGVLGLRTEYIGRSAFVE